MSSHVAYITTSSLLRVLEFNLVPPLTIKQRVVWGLGIKLEADSRIVYLRISSSSDLPLSANEGFLQLGPGEWSHWCGGKHSTLTFQQGKEV